MTTPQRRLRHGQRPTEPLDWSDTASQSQAVPSELANLRYFLQQVVESGKDMNGSYFIPRAVKLLASFDSLFSHSAATGKVPEDRLQELARKHLFEGWPAVLLAQQGIRDFTAALLGAAKAVEPVLNEDDFMSIWDKLGGDAQWLKGFGYYQFGFAVQDEILARLAAPLAGKAEPSVLTPERIAEIHRELQSAAFEREEPITVEDIARAIEREVLARLSKTTAQGTAQSIDTPELNGLLEDYRNASLVFKTGEESPLNKARVAIVKFIAAQAPAGRDAIIEECAQRVEQRAANIGPVELIGEACHETATNVIANVAAAVRALKLPQPATSQTSGGVK